MPQYFTHDHYGRPLTPAVEDLLRSTVIPVPKSISRSKRTNKNNLHLYNDKLRPSILRNTTSLSPPELTTLSVYSVGPSLSGQMVDGESETVGDDYDMDSFFDDIFLLRPTTSRPLLHNLFSLSRSDHTSSSCTSDNADIQHDSFFSECSPSPDDDSSSFNGSYFSIPSTWDESLCSYNKRRISRPTPINIGDNHPLGDTEQPVVIMNSIEKKSTHNKVKSMVSNLTASLRTLTSVAQSFTEAQESLYASRTCLIKTPEPHNNLATKNKPLGASHDHSELEKDEISAPISLKTYRVQSNVIPQVRQRDFRMNSDFYRIYALETLMRLNGKLDAEFRGRAQMILTPRQDLNRYLFDDDDDFIEGVYGIRRRLVSSRNVKERQSSRRSSPLASSN